MQKAIVLILVLAAVVGGYVYFSNQAGAPDDSGAMMKDSGKEMMPADSMMEDKSGDSMMEEGPMMKGDEMMNGGAMMEEAVIITLDAEGKFTPDPVTIKVGTKVTWKNTGDKFIWPASNIHPTHQIYPEFDPKRGIAPSDEWSFVFTKAGVWKYHDHLRASSGGTITVTE